MLQRYLLVWLTLLSGVAYLWPKWLAAHDPFAASKPFLPYLIAATMFAIGGLLPRDEIRQVIRRWPAVVSGTAIQYTAMPFLAYTIGHAFRLEGDLLWGVILVGCVPGAMASNVLTLAARGNVSYSVSLTTSSTLLSPLVVPLALYLTIHQTGINKRELLVEAAQALTLQVVGPVLMGHVLSRRFQGIRHAMHRAGPIVANLAILWIIAVIVNANHQILPSVGIQLAAILLAINLLGYAAGYVGGVVLQLPDGMRRALTLEIGMQNAGLGAVLASQLFPGRATVALPPTLYMFGCMFTGTMLAQLWSLRAPKEGTLAENGS